MVWWKAGLDRSREGRWESEQTQQNTVQGSGRAPNNSGTREDCQLRGGLPKSQCIEASTDQEAGLSGSSKNWAGTRYMAENMSGGDRQTWVSFLALPLALDKLLNLSLNFFIWKVEIKTVITVCEGLRWCAENLWHYVLYVVGAFPMAALWRSMKWTNAQVSPCKMSF